MEFEEDDELNKKLEEINKQIEQAFKNLSDKIDKKLEKTHNLIIKRIESQHGLKRKINDIREIPNIPLRFVKEAYINSIINHIFFCLANLEIITEFILSEEKKEILAKLQGQNYFIVNFFYLMKSIRNKNILNPYSDLMHNYLRNKMGNYYFNQDPAYMIKYFLSMIENEINLAQVSEENIFRYIISNNFSLFLKTKTKCNMCGNLETISQDKKNVLNLYLRNPDAIYGKDIPLEELQSIFMNVLLKGNQILNNPFCIRCGYQTILIPVLSDLKNYLIINLNRELDPNNNMKLLYSTELKILDEKNKENNYELIFALCDITNNIEWNKSNFKMFFKNFINNKWYRNINAQHEELNADIKAEISKYEPNILIYKRM